jgi:hypothetical protein
MKIQKPLAARQHSFHSTQKKGFSSHSGFHRKLFPLSLNTEIARRESASQRKVFKLTMLIF